MDLKGNAKKTDRLILLGLALAGAVMTLVICPFSPLYRYCFEPDEICYLVMSRGWLSGKIPYRDLFDHKGPLTYIIYALGLLLGNGANWGVFVIFALISAGNFTLIYKILRIFYDPGRAFSAEAVLISMFFVKRSILYATGSKPEHIALLFLLLSEYLIAKRVKERAAREKAAPPETPSAQPLLTQKDMYLLGLLAGVVFMIKYNLCAYYLFFIGAYFLWLLVRRSPSSAGVPSDHSDGRDHYARPEHRNLRPFLTSSASFAAGIATIAAPIFLYFASQHALRDFLNVYFAFNLHYAGKGTLKLHFFRTWITRHNQILLAVLFAMMCASAIIALITRKKRAHHLILFACGAATYFALTLPQVFTYSFVVIIPLYLLAFGVLSDFVLTNLPLRILPVAAGIMTAFVLALLSYTNYKASPSLTSSPKALERGMSGFYEAHPDAECLYFATLCEHFFYDDPDRVPDFKYFYLPRAYTREMVEAQQSYIADRIPELVMYYRGKKTPDSYMADLDAFLTANGYSLYINDLEESRVYVYTRDEA